MSLILRVARAGLVAALLVALVGWAVERNRFGASDQDTLARVERELRQRFEASANTLGTIAARADHHRRNDTGGGYARDRPHESR